MNKNMTYKLGTIEHIPNTGEPLGQGIIDQLQKSTTPIYITGWDVTEDSNGDVLLDGLLKKFMNFHGAFTYVMGRGITSEEVIKYEEWLAKEH
jgi:hypothetical protein